MTAVVRVLSRAGVLVFLLLGLAVGTAAPASAHPTLLFTDPATDTAVPESPPVITLVFNEAVTIGPRTVTVLDSGGRPVPVGDATSARGGHVVSARPAGVLPAGTYVVRWQVTGADGDQVEEEFRFAVGTAISGAGTTGGQSIAWADAVLRWLLFAGVAVALGGVVGERFTASARAENPRLRPLRSWVAPATVVGLAGVTGLAAVLVADIGAVSNLWQGRVGQLLLAEAVGLVAALALSAVRGGRWCGWSVLPLGLVVVAEGLRSHANVAAPGWGALLTGVHLAAVAVWVGALVQVARAALAWRRERAAVRWVLAGYVRLALWVFVVVVATGTVTALLLVPLPTVLTTSYGQVLLIKLALVAVAAGLALSARLTLRLTLRRRERLVRVGTLARVESMVLVGVLAVSAVLVSTPPAGSQQPGPPPPHGPVVALGTLAGQVGVSAQASDGQLVVRLTTPRRGDYYAPKPTQDYTLSGQLTAQRESRAVEFRGCGEGCFMSTVDWRDGDNVLTLQAEASSWRGGTVSLLVPWSPQPGAEDLARAAAALRAVDRVTVYEAVTSDTGTGLPEPQRLDLTGEFFVSQEPYAAGTAPIAVRISRPGQPIRLALGYPAVFTNVQLTLDARGRISEETLTDDSHLVHRRFVYPDHG
ncbi:copper resistance protein CopC [Amycolatopsis sp. NPDC006131]|uniref:copper resistance CopC/CopD family protein n=1 Tax=Amycolatopsis sp. NPDC006131 TaxID=3156731 RepID=UPI0033A0CACA